MPLRTECPRCSAPLGESSGDGAGSRWACPDHGPTAVLRRPDVASYQGFVEALSAAHRCPPSAPGIQTAPCGNDVPEPFSTPTFCEGGTGGDAGAPGAPATSAGAPGGIRQSRPAVAAAPADGSSPRYRLPSAPRVGEKANAYCVTVPSGNTPKLEYESWVSLLMV